MYIETWIKYSVHDESGVILQFHFYPGTTSEKVDVKVLKVDKKGIRKEIAGGLMYYLDLLRVSDAIKSQAVWVRGKK